MNLRTYQAYSVAEALAKIREDLGEDAVILHTRTFRRGGVFGMGGKRIVEITASTASQVGRARSKRSERSTRSSKRQSSDSTPDAGDRSGQHHELARRPLHPVGSAAIDAMQTSQSDELATQRQRIQTLLETMKELQPPRQPPRAKAARPETGDSARSTKAELTRSAPASPGKPADVSTPSTSPDYPVAKRLIIDPKSRTARPAPSRPARVEPSSAPTPASTVPTGAREGSDLTAELASLRRLVGQVLQRQSPAAQPIMPEELFKQYVTLIENDVAQEVADEICARVRDELSPARLDDPETVRLNVVRHLGNYIATTDDQTDTEFDTNGRPLTIALIGPTGVGKTTTVAKLAATFKLRHRRRVGLITTDTYRIAAVDQLRTYANIIGIPLKVALTPEEMTSACHELRECDVILIDTAGRSPNDDRRIEEIRTFLDAASPHETHLVLSSTASEAAMVRIVEKFSGVNADRVIFTKLDEAVSFGVLVNVMRRINKRLSFVTTGQEVPDHIEQGRPERLARLILGEKLSE